MDFYLKQKMSNLSPPSRTIAAIATATGQGGIGIIRLSGDRVPDIAIRLLGQLPPPRYAHYAQFKDAQGHLIDEGLALYFCKPHSFTGEHVLELHTHGSPIVLNLLLKHLLTMDISIALPGEFSERAFLNGKMDLLKAEAIADLINASSEQAAHSAARSLQGVFSQQIFQLVEQLIQLRVYTEATLDFPEEDTDLCSDHYLHTLFEPIQKTLMQIQLNATQGVLLRDGMQVVIAGEPNVGKSSLLNQLSGQDTAIVTDVPGTTRDLLRVHIHIDGFPLHIIDTAGLRVTQDIVEKEGIRRAQEAIAKADQILFVIDANQVDLSLDSTLFFGAELDLNKLILVRNKIDLYQEMPKLEKQKAGYWVASISAKTGAGIELLRMHLKTSLGFSHATENIFIARQRHLIALEKANEHLAQANFHWKNNTSAELMAEELRLCQAALSGITGAFIADDLLGEIFRQFCIGK